MNAFRNLLGVLALAVCALDPPPAQAQTSGDCQPSEPDSWQYCAPPPSCMTPAIFSTDTTACLKDFAAMCDDYNETVPVAGSFAQTFCNNMAAFTYPPECSPTNGGQHPRACQTAAVAECKKFMGGGQPFQDPFCQIFFGTFPAPADGVPPPPPGTWPIDGPCNPIDPASWGSCAPPPSCFTPGGVNDPGACQRDFAAMCTLYSGTAGTFGGMFCDGLTTIEWPAECGFSSFLADQPACQAAMAQECKEFQGGGMPFQDEFCDTFFGGEVPDPGSLLPENQPPAADLTATNANGPHPLAVSFTIEMSDPDLTDETTYSLTFGDGAGIPAGSTAATQNHTYAAPGTYTATLTVTDRQGATATDSVTVTATNRAPTAGLTASTAGGDIPLTVTFTVSRSDPDGDATTYVIDYGDGSSSPAGSTAATQTHTYTGAGTFTATLTVADGLGGEATDAVAITATANNAPTAVLSGPDAGTVGQGLVFDGSGSTDPDGDDLAYTFDFGDGVVTEAGGDPLQSHVYATAGIRTVTLTVADGRGGVSTAIHTVTVEDEPPPPTEVRAQLTSDYNAANSEIPLQVTFSAVGSTGPEGATLDYTFVYGDGTQSQRLLTPTATHTYGAAGTYHAYVIVTDGGANADVSDTLTITATVTVVVDPGEPTAAVLMASPASGSAPLTVSFDASDSVATSGASIDNYAFDFGDGSGVVSGTSPTVQHVYTKRGAWTATVTVTDSNGDTAQASATVNVAPGDPTLAVLTAAPESGTAPLTVAFDAQGSVPSSGETIVRYTFNYGDGAVDSGTSPTAQHTYSAGGTYHAMLTVEDSAGDTAEASRTIVVEPGSTTQAELFANPMSGSIPLTVDFDASGSVAGDNAAIVDYSFDFGDGTAGATGVSPTASHVYTEAGDYAATVTVTDDDGNTATATLTIHVGRDDQTTAQLRIDGATRGPAPFTVTFDGSGSIAGSGRTIASYTFNFGDGNSTTGSSPVVTHTYTTPGTYAPTLTVTDDAQTESTVVAKVKVLPAVLPAAPATPSRSGGGALGLALLLPLFGAALRRRRL